MSALGRVVRAPGLILTVVVSQLALGLAIGSSVRSMIGEVMGQHALLTDGHFLFGIFQLASEEPSLMAGSRQLLAGSSVIALVFWTLLAPAVIHRLAAPTSASLTAAAELAAAAVRGLPGVVVTTLWHLIPRAVVLGVTGAAVAGLLKHDVWGWLGLVPLVAVLGYLTCALDLARCNVLLHGARRFHPRTALDGFLQAARAPRVLARSALLSAGQWACVAAIVTAGWAGMGTGYAIWLARILAILGIVLGLTRVAVAVGAGSYRAHTGTARRFLIGADPTAG